jgi:cytochrome c peroxidase
VRDHSSTRRGHALLTGAIVTLPLLAGSAVAAGFLLFDLPPVEAPPENPITEEKRVLGKILFWDEQLSSDNTTSCGTCHIPGSAGTDPRIGINPGLDAVQPSPDDVRGSPGVVSCDEFDQYLPAAGFGLNRQVTTRSANAAIQAMYAPELFWDGRATSQFINPETGAVSIAAGGALESQAAGPPVSSVEMAHAGRDWAQITRKLRDARPLALADDLPPDVASAIPAGTTYPQLFEAAFGDAEITAERIAFAIATYERTLVPDQTDWDRFIAGDPTALTAAEQRGWAAFQGPAARCNVCHTAPQFTNHTFRNLGLRPIAEDSGRQAITGEFEDRGRFKVPTLRNVALKSTFMHNGQFNALPAVMGFYAGGGGPFADNRDPLLAGIALPPPVAGDIVAFLSGGLVDPRVQNEQFPFDRPTLHTELPANPALIGPGVAGTGGRTPRMVALRPPNLGFREFSVGLENVNPGLSVTLAISTNPPVAGRLTAQALAGPFVTGAPGQATFRYPIPRDGSLDGQQIYFQWLVPDAGAPGGVARSSVARLTLFCGNGLCPTNCLADLSGSSDPSSGAYGTPDGMVDAADLFYFLDQFVAGNRAEADLTGDADPLQPLYGIPDAGLDASDFFYFLDLFEAGC